MEEILIFIKDYGSSAVIVAAIIFLFIKIVDFFIKKEETKQKEDINTQNNLLDIKRQDEQYERFVSLFNLFQTSLANDLEKLQKNEEHTVEEQELDRKINEFIFKQLDCLVKKGASRAFVFKLHNGIKTAEGRSFLKMSLVNEAIQYNVQSIMGRYQSMPRMLFPVLYGTLDEVNQYDIFNIEDIKEADPMTAQFLIEHDAKSALFRAIKRSDGLMIGFVGVEFNTKDFDKSYFVNLIEKKTNRIVGAMLGTRDEQN